MHCSDIVLLTECRCQFTVDTPHSASHAAFVLSFCVINVSGSALGCVCITPHLDRLNLT